MKATEMANKHRRTLSSKSRGTLTGSGLDLETKIFSASGRGRTFFLTSLFIELIERSMRSIAGCLLFRILGRIMGLHGSYLPWWLRLDTHSSNDLYVIVYSL